MANPNKRPTDFNSKDTAGQNSAKIIKLTQLGNQVRVLSNPHPCDNTGSDADVVNSSANQQIRINLDALPSFLAGNAIFGHSVAGSEAGISLDDKMLRDQDRFLPIANIARIMKRCVPNSGKIAKESKECMQECISEFISFVTSEAAERCHEERRKTLNGEDLLWALQSLGFEPYVEPLKLYLSKYRAACRGDKSLDVDQFDDAAYELIDADDIIEPNADVDHLADFQRQRRALLEDVISSANDRRVLQTSAVVDRRLPPAAPPQPNPSALKRVVQLKSASNAAGQLLLRQATLQSTAMTSSSSSVAIEEPPCDPRGSKQSQQNQRIPVLYLDSSGHLSSTAISSHQQQNQTRQSNLPTSVPSTPQNVQFFHGASSQQQSVALQSPTTTAAKRTHRGGR